MTQDDTDTLEGSFNANEDILSTTKGPPVFEEAKAEERAGIFNHALSSDFIRKLEIEATKAGWWADVLADRELFIAPRGKYLNVYWRGQSLFLVACHADKLTVTTHPKFLLDPALEQQVPLQDGIFETRQNGLLSRYDPKPNGTTLEKMKTAAALFASREKIGCHGIAINSKNSGIIDCEIQFPLVKNEKKAARIDLASFVRHDEKSVHLVFWEAKHYTNGDLRSDLEAERLPAVFDQVQRYKRYISEFSEALVRSYQQVAGNLVALQKMGAKRHLSDAIEHVAKGPRQCKLLLEKEPKVGLVIFGFDKAQRDHADWLKHFDRLKTKSKISYVIARGKAGNIVLPAEAA